MMSIFIRQLMGLSVFIGMPIVAQALPFNPDTHENPSFSEVVTFKGKFCDRLIKSYDESVFLSSAKVFCSLDPKQQGSCVRVSADNMIQSLLGQQVESQVARPLQELVRVNHLCEKYQSAIGSPCDQANVVGITVEDIGYRTGRPGECSGRLWLSYEAPSSPSNLKGEQLGYYAPEKMPLIQGLTQTCQNKILAGLRNALSDLYRNQRDNWLTMPDIKFLPGLPKDASLTFKFNGERTTKWQYSFRVTTVYGEKLLGLTLEDNNKQKCTIDAAGTAYNLPHSEGEDLELDFRRFH